MSNPAIKDGRKEGECTCHLSAPCSFCLSLSEKEADIGWNEGQEGLRKYWDSLEESEE